MPPVGLSVIIQERLDKLTHTTGGHQVRGLRLLVVICGHLIIGELKSLDSDKWCSASAYWRLSGEWLGGVPEYDLMGLPKI
jgi:hypothetical protein